jgi:hypothetical protein
MGVNECTEFLNLSSNEIQPLKLDLYLGAKKLEARVDTGSRYLVLHEGLLNVTEVKKRYTRLNATVEVSPAFYRDGGTSKIVHLYDLKVTLGGTGFIMKAVFLPRTNHKHGLLGREIFRCFNLTIGRSTTGKGWSLDYDPLGDCRQFLDMEDDFLDNLDTEVWVPPSELGN